MRLIRKLFTLLSLFAFASAAMAQDHINPEDRVVDMNSPTFVPMVHIGKAKVGSDSIQYVRTSNVYVFPPMSSKIRLRKRHIIAWFITSRRFFLLLKSVIKLFSRRVLTSKLSLQRRKEMRT